MGQQRHRMFSAEQLGHKKKMLIACKKPLPTVSQRDVFLRPKYRDFISLVLPIPTAICRVIKLAETDSLPSLTHSLQQFGAPRGRILFI